MVSLDSKKSNKPRDWGSVISPVFFPFRYLSPLITKIKFDDVFFCSVEASGPRAQGQASKAASRWGQLGSPGPPNQHSTPHCSRGHCLRAPWNPEWAAEAQAVGPAPETIKPHTLHVLGVRGDGLSWLIIRLRISSEIITMHNKCAAMSLGGTRACWSYTALQIERWYNEALNILSLSAETSQIQFLSSPNVHCLFLWDKLHLGIWQQAEPEFSLLPNRIWSTIEVSYGFHYGNTYQELSHFEGIKNNDNEI